jgi:hypothetical protein
VLSLSLHAVFIAFQYDCDSFLKANTRHNMLLKRNAGNEVFKGNFKMRVVG